MCGFVIVPLSISLKEPRRADVSATVALSVNECTTKEAERASLGRHQLTLGDVAWERVQPGSTHL
jgi:hypothetical protein